ncbi:lysophospholipid acyltransferase family protein [Clostridium taeniosporum]|uniref:1-acyl-sn-glycerol-3-phosphate acyltransferase n=1 Tax=Clostridium taeniosporum TaxID=394958 RepID=A0A1D7XN97_9CLOT|nr:lysophospholipid acyltransferase family protein [Clostridium taeniosporum]AOR24794.1 1-acyl-sn-glycerol-3-phosphate acyltransferase [Clostridium taeniosporum]
MIRTIIFFIIIVFSLLLVSTHTFKIKSLEKKGKLEEKNKLIHKVTSNWAKFIMKASGAKINVIGLENIPKDETILFISNHQSNFDIPLLMSSIDVPKGFIAKKELETVPFISTWMKHINCVFIDRKNLRKSAEAIVQGIKILKSGYSMVIFPEGTRSKGKDIGDFKSGSFKLALKSKCVIVPLTINGTYKLLEETNRIKPSDIELIIHKPIYTKNLTKEEQEKLPNTVRTIICSRYKSN